MAISLATDISSSMGSWLQEHSCDFQLILWSMTISLQVAKLQWLSCVSLFWTSGFPDSSVGKESTCNAVDAGLIPGSGRSAGEGIGYPLQYSRLKNSMDWPWDCKESDTTERLTLFTFSLNKVFLSLLEEMATHSSIPVWEIPWTEEPGRLWSMGLQESYIT